MKPSASIALLKSLGVIVVSGILLGVGGCTKTEGLGIVARYKAAICSEHRRESVRQKYEIP